MAARDATVAAMTSFLVALSPWLAGALIGAIIAGVLNRHQPTWYEAIVHCVGGSYVGAGVASYFFARPVIPGPSLSFGLFHLLLFWLIVPVLFGSAAALVATRRQ